MSKTTWFNRDYVESLTEPGDYRDKTLPGFYIRVRLSKRSGKITRTYLVNGKIAQHRKNITVTVGTSDEFTPKQAAAKALEYLAAMANGINPNQVKQVQRDMSLALAEGRKAAKAKKDITLRVVLDTFISKHTSKLASKTLKDYRLFLERCVPQWLDTPIEKITQSMILSKHQELSKDPAQADYSMRILRRLFNFARYQYGDMQIARENPVAVLSQAKAWNKPKRRQTIIRDTDFPAWAKAVQELEYKDARDFLLLALFTGLRKSEAEGLKWSNVDLDVRTIKVEDTKNGSDFVLPTCEIVTDILRSRLPIRKKSPFVFPGEGSTGHMIQIRNYIDKVIESSGVKFTLHDLRRTFETTAERLDISYYTLKRLLNHSTKADVTAGYIVTSPERLREAMDRVEKKLLELMKGKAKGKTRRLSVV